MALSNDLISQFVKITNDDKNKKSDKTVYGTVVEYDGSKYVKLDGSELLTPISMTTNANNNERVTVMIKNHSAVVTGNISSPSPRTAEVEEIGSKISEFDTIIADKVDTAELNAEIARIDQLQSDNVTIKDTLNANNASIRELEAKNVTVTGQLDAINADIENLEAEDATITGRLDAADADIDSLQADNATIKSTLTANTADITDLKAKHATVTGRLDANEADIDDLQANKLSATDADLKYANIDFSNIGKAAFEYFYANSGLIRDVVVDNGTITGHLIGVTISGDLIEGNTIVAEKLVIKGEDGLYYQLNMNGESVEAQQTDYNSLNGSVIRAKSVTAEKISVEDLVAFGATIASFNITDTSLYSGVKESVDNTTRGIYMDVNGQMAVGDSVNFIKFFEDTDGTYKLSISAASIKLGSSQRSIEAIIEDATNEIEIGGRNLLKGTRTMSSENWYGMTGTGKSLVELDNGFVGERIERSDLSSAAYTSCYAKTDNVISSGESYILCADTWIDPDGTVLDGNCSLALDFYNADGTSLSTAKTTLSPSDTSGVWKRISVKAVAPENAVYAQATMMLSKNGNITFARLKLEKGNKATDWTPFPDELEEGIASAQETAYSADSKADANTERLNSADLQIDALNGAISNLVTDQNGQSLMTQTGSGWTFNISAIQDALNKAIVDIETLNSDSSDTNAALDNLKTNVDDLGEYTEYIEFGTDGGKPCIILGERDSVFKVVITNTDIRFMEGSDIPAYISNQSLNIKKAVISEELKQGGFVWMARENGNYGLLWKGV